MANNLESKRIHYIYKTTNILNQKYYIGMHSTSNLQDGYLGSGTVLRRSIRKYGKENFRCEILEYCNDREELKQKEKEFVTEQVRSDPYSMNLQLGGGGGLKSEEHKEKWNKAGSIAHRKYLIEDPQYKKRVGEAISKAAKMGYATGKRQKRQVKDWTGCKHKKSSKLKMRQAKLGKGLKENNSQYGTMWITDGTINKKIKKEGVIPEGFAKGRIWAK